MVARAWVDPEYKQRLLTDAGPAIAELGFLEEVDDGLGRVIRVPANPNG